MAETKPSIKVELTPEQKDALHRATGKKVMAIELHPEKLEERIAPRLAAN